jgi:tetratricopeptide (TPR) repeat protein
MNRAVRATATVAVAILVAAAAAAPASAQTGSVWHDQKMFDMKSHERNKAFDRRATEHYELALSYVQTLDTLAAVEDRSPRQEKKLQQAYERATKHLEESIEASPDFVAARMMLGAVHYRMKDYEDARAAYQGVLEVEPDNQDAKAYLSSVEYYLQRAGSATAESGGG